MQLYQPIMIIDDDPINNFLSKLAIRDSFPLAHVIEFENAMDALIYLNSKKEVHKELPAIILLDLNMPVMEGWLFLEEYSKISHQLVSAPLVFVLSASDYSEDIDKAKKSNVVSSYIIKPLTAAKLTETTNQLSTKP